MENNYKEIVTKAVKNNLSNKEINYLLSENEKHRKKEFKDMEIKGVPESFYLLFAQHCIDQGFDNDDICEFFDAKIYDVIEDIRARVLS
jgi:hypothetical protein